MRERTKKLLQFGGLLLLAGMVGTSVYVQKAQAGRNAGAIGPQDSATRHSEWLWVYNTDVNGAHEAGDVVVWADGSNDGLDVSTTTTANNGLVAGVVPVGTTLGAESWGWIQTHGYHSAITIGVANSAGDSLVTSTTGEAAGVYSVAQATGTASGQSQAFGVFAVALDATTSSTTVKGFILR